jgi:hypothetical protein
MGRRRSRGVQRREAVRQSPRVEDIYGELGTASVCLSAVSGPSLKGGGGGTAVVVDNDE